MMYCPRCNNTHWTPIPAKRTRDRLAILRLKRPYCCKKCERIQLGSIFLDFKWPKFTQRKKRKKQSKPKSALGEVKCPQCGGTVRRSRRRGLERFMLFSRAYRCAKCETRFRAFKFV